MICRRLREKATKARVTTLVPLPPLWRAAQMYLSAGRVGDKYASHSCVVHASHQDNIAEGSATVFINGIAARRKGDAVKIGGSVDEGSPDVVIGG